MTTYKTLNKSVGSLWLLFVLRIQPSQQTFLIYLHCILNFDIFLFGVKVFMYSLK